MAPESPSTMSIPITFYNHGELGTGITVSVDHATKHLNLVLQRPGSPPLAIKQIPREDATWFAHLTLHRHDLDSAKKYLDEFRRLTAADDASLAIARDALWIAALITTIKCFDTTSKARDPLNANTIFGPQPTSTASVRYDFDSLKNLRNKHISHDENDWLRAIPATVIENPNSNRTISSVHGIVFRGESSHSGNIDALDRVITDTSVWVKTTWTEQAESLLTYLRTLNNGQVDALSDITGTLPSTASLGVNRGK